MFVRDMRLLDGMHQLVLQELARLPACTGILAVTKHNMMPYRVGIRVHCIGRLCSLRVRVNTDVPEVAFKSRFHHSTRSGIQWSPRGTKDALDDPGRHSWGE